MILHHIGQINGAFQNRLRSASPNNVSRTRTGAVMHSSSVKSISFISSSSLISSSFNLHGLLAAQWIAQWYLILWRELFRKSKKLFQIDLCSVMISIDLSSTLSHLLLGPISSYQYVFFAWRPYLDFSRVWINLSLPDHQLLLMYVFYRNIQFRFVDSA